MFSKQSKLIQNSTITKLTLKSLVPLILLSGCQNTKVDQASDKGNAKEKQSIASTKVGISKTNKTKKIESKTVPGPRALLKDLNEVKTLKNAYSYWPKPKTEEDKKANALVNKALDSIQSGKYIDAKEFAKEAKAASSSYPRVWNLLGSLEFSSNHNEEAGLAFYNACKLDTNYATAWVNLSSVYIAQERYQAAARVYKHLIKLAPDEAASWAMMGMIYTHLEDGLKAEKCYKKALSLDPKNSQTIFELAYCYHCQQKYKEAESLYKKSLAIDPNNRIGWLYLSLAQAKLNKPKEAAASKRKMASLNSKIDSKSGILSKQDTNKLIAYYQSMIKANPKDPAGYKNLGSVYISKRQYQKALPLLEKANRFKPFDEETVCLLAQSMISSGAINEAIDLMEESLKKNKSDYPTTILLSYTFYSQKDYANAEKYAREAIKLDPKSENAWSMLCDSLLPQQKYKEQVEASKRLISLNPGVSSGIWCILIQGLMQQNKFKEAQKALGKANTLYPKDYRVQKSYGLFFGLQNDINNAEKYFKKAVKLNPGGAKCWYQLANIYQTKEDKANYVNALVKTAVATNDTAGINYKELADKLETANKAKEATLALKKASDSTPDHKEWMTLHHSPGQDRPFPVSLRGVD